MINDFEYLIFTDQCSENQICIAVMSKALRVSTCMTMECKEINKILEALDFMKQRLLETGKYDSAAELTNPSR